MQNAQTVTLSFEALADLLKQIFMKAGINHHAAEIIGNNCASCERDGAESHGIFRMEGYLNTIKSGWINGHAKPVIEFEAPSMIRIDADNGFAQVALAHVREQAIEKARLNGACIVSIRNSHHFSALWPDLEPFARQGLVALTCASSLPVVVPPGGQEPVYGTNPIAFATPVEGRDPYVFDFASSALSNGDTRIAAREGRLLAKDSGVDSDGRPTTDPNAILNGGALLPFGGHKGAAIIFMVEVLASALTGANFSKEVDFSDHAGAETPRTGQFLLLADPQIGNNHGFSARVNQLVEWVKASGASRLPGERRYAKRRQNGNQVTVAKTVYDKLTAYAG